MSSSLKPPTNLKKDKKRHSKSGSFAYDILSDHGDDDNNNDHIKDTNNTNNNLNDKTNRNRNRSSNPYKIDDYKKMQNIRVIARFRPKNKREDRWSRLNNMDDKPPQFLSQQSVSLEQSSISSSSSSSQSNRRDGNISIDFNNRSFNCTLDAVLTEQCTQKQVFYRCGLPMIMSCLDGYNATIFAYGQSGSGKTYTMMGPENNVKSADDFGLVPRCIIYLFQKLDESLSNNGGPLQDYIINMELLQIYKSQLLDLLNPKCKKKLIIKTNFSNNNVFVQNLRSVPIQTVEEAFKLLTSAQQNRIVAGHSLNEVSSRSHMLITMTVIQRYIDGTLKTSKLNFADLAGSEDLTKALGSNPDKERKKEAIAINKSLSALTTAVSYLSRGQKPGFRDSPLTHILKDSLGGNSKTIMLVTASPHIYNRAETIRTLRFASTAKKVKNKAKINEEKSIVALKKRIKELERQNGKLRQQLISAKQQQQTKVHHDKVINDKVNDMKHSKTNTVEIKETEDDRGSVVMHSDGENDGNEGDMDPNRKATEHGQLTDDGRKHRDSVVLADDDEQDDDEWGSDSDHDEIANHLGAADIKHSDDSDDSEEESHFELNEYIQQINEYREKLDRESEENEVLQIKIDEKNIELESCANKIAELEDELNQNEHDFYDSKTKICHLQHVLNQYQQQYPSFKPDLSSSSSSLLASASNPPTASPSPLPMMLSSNGKSRRSTLSISSTSPNLYLPAMPDDYDIVPDLLQQSNMNRRNSNNRFSLSSRPSLSRRDTIVHQTNLLQDLLMLHQRMESKMQQTESALNELRNASNPINPTKSPSPPHQLQRVTSLQIMASNSLQPIKSNHSTQPNGLENVHEDSPMDYSLTRSKMGSLETVDINDSNDSHDHDILSTLVYESADEKLDEWDLDVSTGRDSEISKENNNENDIYLKPPKVTKSKSSVVTKKIDNDKDDSSGLDEIEDSKELRKHLRSLSKNEKKLKKDLKAKLKKEAVSTTSWCRCFFNTPQKNEGVTSQLIEEYLKTQVRKELVKGKYVRKKQKKHKNRAKAIKKDIKNNNKRHQAVVNQAILVYD